MTRLERAQLPDVRAERPREVRTKLLLAASIPCTILIGTLIYGIAEHDDFGIDYLPVMGIVIVGLLMGTAPLWTMAARVTVTGSGIEISSFFGTTVLIPWKEIENVGIYGGRPLWGSELVVKIVRKRSSGLTTRALLFFPLNEHMTNFDSLVAEIKTKPITIKLRPGLSDQILWGAIPLPHV